MTEQEHRRKVLRALGKIGLTCTSMHHFTWRRKEKEIEVSLEMDATVFLEACGASYTEKEKEDWNRFEKYYVDKLLLEFKNERVPDKERRMTFEIDYVFEEEEPMQCYLNDTYYKYNYHPYDRGWIALLKKNGFEEFDKKRELAEIFNKDGGNQLIKSAMIELESKMDIPKKWIENEVAKQIKRVLDNLSNGGKSNEQR